MNNINLGVKIRELRKKKGITQEGLASVLSVSPQAISKWESGVTYPDMEMIPVIAGYFEVSLDMLFDYDLREMKTKIEKIIDDAREAFFDDTERYAEIIKAALAEYPGNEELIEALLKAYEYAMREKNDLSHLDEMVDLCKELITESSDILRICDVKGIQAAAYLKKRDYQKAKSVLESLPADYGIRDGKIAFRLEAKDKLNGAVRSRCYHLQELYQACMEEGDAWFFMDRYPDVTFRDYTSEEYVPEALKSYQKGLKVLTTFLLTDYYDDPADQYLWDGMQTFHWCFLQCIAACYKKLGDIEECERYVKEAYRIISVTWRDFEECREEYMVYFDRYLREYDLAEYIR